MKSFWQAANTVVRPCSRAWFAGSKLDWSNIPQPTDAPHVVAPGCDPDVILLIGDGPAMGFGVTSHDIALPGHVARQVSALTGRGVSLHVVADEALTVHNIEARFAGAQPQRYDAVVVMIGATDSARLTAVRVWRDGLRGLLRRVETDGPRGVQIVLVGIPPISRFPILKGIAALFAARHSLLLNRELRAAATAYPNVTFLPFVPPAESDPLRYRTATTYQAWARKLAPTVAGVLELRLTHVVNEPSVVERAGQG